MAVFEFAMSLSMAVAVFRRGLSRCSRKDYATLRMRTTIMGWSVPGAKCGQRQVIATSTRSGHDERLHQIERNPR